MNLIQVPIFQANNAGNDLRISEPVRIIDNYVINADKIISICHGKHNDLDVCTVRVSRDIYFFVNLSLNELIERIEDGEIAKFSTRVKEAEKAKAPQLLL